jgi:hypothetical protein
MQQRVTCFSEAEGLPEGINWKKATEHALIAAWEPDEWLRDAINKNEFYDCAWYTFDKTLLCPNTACHAALSSLRATTPFLLNVPLHYHWVNAELNKSIVKKYYDWMNDPIMGLWRSCMQDAVILVDDEDFPIATLWTDIKNVPIYPLVHYCLSSRFLTEHVSKFKQLEERFKETNDIHLAFLLCVYYNAAGSWRGQICHSSWRTSQFYLPKRWVVPHDFTETIAGEHGSTVFVNEMFERPSVKFTGKPKGLIEKYKELKGC